MATNSTETGVGTDYSVPKKITMSAQMAFDLLENHEDFIACKRFGFSLANLLERHPEGAPDSLIAAALLISEDEIEPLYNEIVEKLRREIGHE